MDNLNELDQILADHRSREIKQRAAADDKQVADKQWHTDCSSQLTEIVLPVLNDFSDRLTAAKHQTEITEQLGGYISPSMALSLIPRSKQIGLPSVITFICAESRRIEVEQEIRNKGVMHRPGLAAGEVDRDWVEKNLLRFVKTVLSG